MFRKMRESQGLPTPLTPSTPLLDMSAGYPTRGRGWAAPGSVWQRRFEKGSLFTYTTLNF